MIPILLLLLGVLFTVPANGQELLTLSDAIAIAVENNRLVEIAGLEVEKAADEIEVTRKHRLPAFNVGLFEGALLTKADFEFPAGSFGTFPTTGPIPSVDTLIRTPRRPITLLFASLTQPISQLHRIGLGVKLRELNHDLAREELRAQESLVINQVKQVYYGVIKAEAGLKAAEQSIRLLEELQRVAEESLTQEVLLESEILQVRARLAQARVDEARLRNGSSTQKKQLNALLGRDINTDYQVSASPEMLMPEMDLNMAQSRALTQRPEIREARIKAEQAQFNRRLKKAEYIPDVSFALGYLSPLNFEVVPNNILAAGVMVKWDVFDWGRKKQELASRASTLRQAEVAIDEAEAQILIEVEHQFKNLQVAAEQLRANELARVAAEESLRVITAQYSEEEVLLKDVLETQARLAESEYRYQESLASFWMIRADFEKAVGER